MKKIELNNKTKEELANMLEESKGKLLKLRLELAENKLKDVSQLGKTKKDIARIMTALNSQNPK